MGQRHRRVLFGMVDISLERVRVYKGTSYSLKKKRVTYELKGSDPDHHSGCLMQFWKQKVAGTVQSWNNFSCLGKAPYSAELALHLY